MGAKTGYADVILRCLGLRPGGGADRYLWCEPDAGVRLLLHAYTDRALALAAAEVIRGWKDEEPRALWERLRAEGPAVCPPVDAREVARFVLCGVWSYRQSEVESGFVGPGQRRQDTTATATATARIALDLPATITADARDIDPREVARAARLLTANRLINLDPQTWQNTGEGGTTHGGAEFCTDAAVLADALGAAVEVAGAAVVDDARAVDPREVARWSCGMLWTVAGTWPGGGFCGPGHVSKAGKIPFPSGTTYQRHIAARFDRVPELPATITDDARAVDPPQLPPGVVAYIDPPYLNTTGYAHAFPRSEWLPIVRRWAEAGALVCVSEAEPIPDLMAEGWHAVEITGERKGQKRTFSKQQREWLTISRPPAWKPSIQGQLFGREL